MWPARGGLSFLLLLSVFASALFAAENATPLWERVAAIQPLAEEYPVWWQGKSVPIKQLSAKERQQARDRLELYFETATEQRDVPGGEVAIRKMLRALNYAIGPNKDSARAVRWRAVAYVVRGVDLDWTDAAGKARVFRSRTDDQVKWEKWCAREMRRLSDIVFEKSLGRINLEVETLHGAGVLVQNLKGGRWDADVGGAAPPQARRGHFLFGFAFIPVDPVSGERPPLLGTATTGGRTVKVYTSRERMEREGGWAFDGAGGLLHEFWHLCQWAMNSTGFKGTILTNHGDATLTMLKAEYREQGFPEPTLQYDALLCSYPTWRMCRKVKTPP